MSEATPDQVDVESVLKCIWNEVVWLDNRWLVCQSLFGSNKSDLDTLNQRTGTIFRIFQGSIIDDIILSIAKLLDPAKSRVRREERLNATFNLVLEKLPPHVPEPTRRKLAEDIASLRGHCDTLLQHRNRRIAHADLKAALDEEPPDKVTVRTIIEAIALAKVLLNDMGLAIIDGTYGFDLPSLRHEAQVLLRIIKLGNEAMDAERRAKTARLRKLAGETNVEAPDDPLNDLPY
jgi:hypothetical protein